MRLLHPHVVPGTAADERDCGTGDDPCSECPAMQCDDQAGGGVEFYWGIADLSVDDMIRRIDDALCVDTSLRFALGFSYGGAMSYSLACSRPTVFRAVAAIAAIGFTYLGAIDIERGRDHGMPTYNQLRQAYGLAPRNSFTAITGESSDGELTSTINFEVPGENITLGSTYRIELRQNAGAGAEVILNPGKYSLTATLATRLVPVLARDATRTARTHDVPGASPNASASRSSTARSSTSSSSASAKKSSPSPCTAMTPLWWALRLSSKPCKPMAARNPRALKCRRLFAY